MAVGGGSDAASSSTAPTRSADAARADTVVGASDTSSPSASQAKRLGPYALVRLIAHGGMGAVWEAVDTRLDRRVAVKVLLRGDEARPEDLERFHREALHVAKLHHPNIVPIHDVGVEGGRHYLVMDLVSGTSLAETVRQRPLSYREQARLVEKVARAVHYAHEQGVVHRDLKPANVLIERPTGTRLWRRDAAADDLGEPLVADFGLAKDVADDSSLSRTGQAMGTPSYMPPEQAEGRIAEIGPASDVYSLGAILYELLVGRPPFVGETPLRILRSVVEDDPLRPRALTPSMPRDLETICLTCLAKRPERRYRSAAALADDLAAWLGGDAISARRAGAIERLAQRVRKRPAAWAAGALAVLLAIASVAAALWVLDARARAARSELTAATERESAARERAREWQLVFADDFARDDLAERWDVSTDGIAEIRDHRLHLRNGIPQVAMPRGGFAGDVRIEFTCRFGGGELTDLSCFVDVHRTGGIPNGDDGYLFQFGGKNNTVTRLLRDSDVVGSEIRGPVLERDHVYHAVAQRVGGRLTYAIDGKVVIDVVDPLPLGDRDRTRVGIYGWVADAWIGEFKVWRLGEARSTDVIDLLDRRLARDEAVDPAALVDAVIASANDPARVARARAVRERLDARTRLDADLERTRTALALAWPGARVDAAEGEVEVSLAGLPARDLAALATLPIRRLDLAGCAGLRDLAPLRGMPLRDLSLSSTGVSDLGPLAGMPLRRLEVHSCRALVDLAPIAHLPLEELIANDSPIADLSPLAGMRLRRLELKLTNVTDLSPLAGMPLTTLLVDQTSLRSLAPLAGMPLERLSIRGVGAADLAVLAGMPLRELRCGDNAITDLGPLAGAPLRQLSCDGNAIVDLAPLARSPLAELDCAGNRIRDLTPLRGLPLVTLRCDRDPIADLSPLAGMRLEQLSCDDDAVGDLTPLTGMPLRELRCRADPIASLAPLAGMPLEVLDCSRTSIADLRPLAHAPLVDLDCAATAVADLSPLAPGALCRVWCRGSRVTDLSPLTGANLYLIDAIDAPVRALGPVARRPPAVLLVDDASLPAADAAAVREAWLRLHGHDGRGPRGVCNLCAEDLRACAVRVRDRSFVRLPWQMWYGEAAGIARAVGGRLADPRDDEEARLVLRLAGDDLVWIGDHHHGPGGGDVAAPCVLVNAPSPIRRAPNPDFGGERQSLQAVVEWE